MLGWCWLHSLERVPLKVAGVASVSAEIGREQGRVVACLWLLKGTSQCPAGDEFSTCQELISTAACFSCSTIHISRKCWHMLLNLCFHIAMTSAVFAGGITLTNYLIVCQAVGTAMTAPASGEAVATFSAQQASQFRVWPVSQWRNHTAALPPGQSTTQCGDRQCPQYQNRKSSYIHLFVSSRQGPWTRDAGLGGGALEKIPYSRGQARNVDGGEGTTAADRGP